MRSSTLTHTLTNPRRNIFDERKYVEAFMASDIERELGLRRVDLVALALLLGSDYTEGVRGVGIVNATEIVRAFPCPGAAGGEEGPPEQGLQRFKRWLDGFDPLGELGVGGQEERGRGREEWVDDSVEAFHKKHRSARTRWVVTERFPDPAIFKAYMQPQVNGATDPFTWELPDLDRIRVFSAKKLGWPVADTDAHLLPMLRRMQERGVQTRLDSYYRAYEDNVTFAKIKSKRLRTAVAQLTGQAEAALPLAVRSEGEEEEEGGGKGKEKKKAAKAGGRGNKGKGKGKGKQPITATAAGAGGKRKRIVKTTKKGRYESEDDSTSSDSEKETGAAAVSAAAEADGGSNGTSKRPQRAAAQRRKVVVDEDSEEEEDSEEGEEEMDV